MCKNGKLNPVGYFMYHQVLSFKDSLFCPESAILVLYIVQISETTAIIPLYMQYLLFGFSKSGGRVFMA